MINLIDNTMYIAIFGIGAMGTLFASRMTANYGDQSSVLARTNITLIGTWREQINALKQNGLTVIKLDGSKSHHTIHVTDNLTDVSPADIALILVKSHQTARVAQQAAQVLHPNGIAITLQNGLGNLEILSETLGSHRVALGTTSQAATLLAPGYVQHTGKGPTHLANAPSLKKQLCETAFLFNEVGLETILVENADTLVWGKLVINAGINPLTALLEVTNGALLENPCSFQWMSAAVNEVASLAAAQDITLPFADAVRRAVQVCRATAKNRSSMLQDVLRHAPTEIDFISGAVVRFGKRLGIPTPVNEFLLKQVKLKEAGNKFEFKQLQLLTPDYS